MTTIGAALPLVFMGSDFLAPLGIAIIGGFIASTLSTLFFVLPPLYHYARVESSNTRQHSATSFLKGFSVAMEKVFSPFTIRGIEFRNRYGLSPMCQYVAKDGLVQKWHHIHYGSRSMGIGLAIIEATAISKTGMVTPADLGLWCDEQIDGMSELAHTIVSMGAVPGVQICHGGRKSSRTTPAEGDVMLSREEGGWEIMAPSPIPFSVGYDTPSEMTTQEIEQTITEFKESALRALKAGFKVLELHGGHGRLIHSFLSPISNKRQDHYGGESFDNRTRYVEELVTAIREVWPAELPLFLRLSCVDWLDDGWTIEDSVQLAVKLKILGVDLIDCTSGGIIRPITKDVYDGYQVSFSETIRKEAGIQTAAVGVINSVEAVASIIDNDQADLVLLGRKLIEDPFMPARIAVALNASYEALPIPYRRAVRSVLERQTEFIPEL